MSTKASWGAENGQGWFYPSLQGRSSEYVPHLQARWLWDLPKSPGLGTWDRKGVGGSLLQRGRQGFQNISPTSLSLPCSSSRALSF